MKDYKRLTKRCGDIVNYAKPLQSNFIGAIYEEQKERDSEIMSRLAELEDKIESGELCDGAELGQVKKDRDEYKHRAQVAERALENEIKNRINITGDVENLVYAYYGRAIYQAEKRLAELKGEKNEKH